MTAAKKAAPKRAAKVKLITSRKLDDGRTVFDFRCPHFDGCGVPDGEAWSSIGWTSRELAVERGKQHLNEHETGEVVPELHEFRIAKGLTPEQAGDNVRPDEWEF